MLNILYKFLGSVRFKEFFFFKGH